VAAILRDASIPRIGGNVGPPDWDDQNAYPFNSAGLGNLFLEPKALIDAGATRIALVRIETPGTGSLAATFQATYAEAEIVADIPLTAGTTDFTQFIQTAEDAGAEGIALAVGEQEALQIVRAAEQLGSDLLISTGIASFTHETISGLGPIAEQIIFVASYPPHTADLPVYEALRSDLAASGEERFEPQNMRQTALQSWMALYATIKMIRDAGLTDFTAPNMKAMVEAAADVPMLGMFGDENWTPDTDHQGLYVRSGMDFLASYRWDPEAAAVDGLVGNWVEFQVYNFSEVVCGSVVGAPAETC
jgi:ABC-type branched-subunit amino acid transport system substrate-binding protein